MLGKLVLKCPRAGKVFGFCLESLRGQEGGEDGHGVDHGDQVHDGGELLEHLMKFASLDVTS